MVSGNNNFPGHLVGSVYGQLELVLEMESLAYACGSSKYGRIQRYFLMRVLEILVSSFTCFPCISNYSLKMDFFLN